MIPERCCKCEHYEMDRHLEYYNFPFCKKNGKEIKFGTENGWDRMKWCPLLTQEERIEELKQKAKECQSELHEFFIYSNKRTEDPERFVYLASVVSDRLSDAIDLLKEQDRESKEWIEIEDGNGNTDIIICSVCNTEFHTADNCTEEFYYCPHCGAKMEGR